MSAILEVPNSIHATQVETLEQPVPTPKSFPLFLEIGCEEIPARFLTDAQQQFGERLRNALEQARLLPAAAAPGGEPPFRTYSTPRRLVAHLPVSLTQPDKVEEVTGPPVKVAFDTAGKPTRAAESFAQKNGVRVEDLLKVATPKGEYLQAKKLIEGRPALAVLQEILPGVISGLTFPKSMYWEPSKVRFVRPIRWIVALLGGGDQARVVPFEVAGVRSGDLTYGHRALGTAPVSVSGFDDYARKLRDAQVEFDPAKRRSGVLDRIEVALKLPGLDVMAGTAKILRAGSGQTDPDDRLEEIRSHIRALPNESDLRLIPDRDLEDWVVNSTECPHPILGTFEERFLKLPREILITVMRDHQKYFAVESGDGKLQSCFVTVLNAPKDPKGLIRAGHERVLTARFSDAEFFWNADQKVSLKRRWPILSRVTYQAKLESQGTYWHKIDRMKRIARLICDEIQVRGGAVESDRVLEAVELCKCDLTTQMAQEFTELQGVVGGLYAREEGAPDLVWQAIYDHYKPASMEDGCPRSAAGAVVSMADKLDALLAGFSVGLVPTGSSDPFALRRAGNGIIKLAAEKLPAMDLRRLVESLASLPLGLSNVPGVLGDVIEFLKDRAEYYLRDVRKLPYDVTGAVVNSTLSWGKPRDAQLRGEALKDLRDAGDFAALSQAAKRTRNILTKSADVTYEPGISNVRPDLFQEPAEGELYRAFVSLWDTFLEHEKQGRYRAGFLDLAKVRAPIDQFFDSVLVMTEDPALKKNRLTLLNSLDALVFSRWADLSLIGSSPDAKAGPDTKVGRGGSS